MGDNTYNPEKLVDNYLRMPYGKARTAAMRYAMEQADLNNDLEYMLYFRMELCDETEWYGNGLDNFVVFPELLAIVDKNPDNGKISRKRFYEIMGNILWTYESLLSLCSEYYQIPLKDCINFHNDFKKRWTAYGRSPREPYRMMCGFYRDAGYTDKAGEALSMLKASPMEDYDCTGCIANTELSYYLSINEKEKADRLAEKIEEQEQISDSVEVIRAEVQSASPRKGFIKTALKGLQAINGTAQFGAAIATLVQFLGIVL